MEHNLNDLRGHLFDSIEKLKSGQMDVKTALAVSDLGKTLVETAKVELGFLKHVDSRTPTSNFLGGKTALAQSTTAGHAQLGAAPVSDIARRYGKAQGVYYELKDGEVDPISLERITEAIGQGGIKLVPHYMSFTELKKKMLSNPV